MSKRSRLARKRFFRTSAFILIAAGLFWLAMDLGGYSLEKDSSLFRKIPVPKKMEGVLGMAKRLTSLGKEEESEKPQAPKPETLSLAKAKEEAKEKVVTESKEVVRGKMVEILRELIDKLTEDEETKGQVCDQVCEELCQEACE